MTEPCKWVNNTIDVIVYKQFYLEALLPHITTVLFTSQYRLEITLI